MSATGIDPELLRRLPRTFVPALNESLNRWDLLFPAEQRALTAQLEYLGRMPAREFDALFRRVKEIEARMQLPAWGPSSSRISIADTSVLVRSPLYSEWRTEVERVFGQIEAGIPAPLPVPKVIVCVLPGGLPLPSTPLWPRLGGRWMTLERPFGALAPDLLDRIASAAEAAWAFDAAHAVPAFGRLKPLSFDALANVRREFLRRLNLIRKDLRSADEIYAQVRQLDVQPLLPRAIREDRRVAAFLRDLFLSGNGSMLFGNSFVEWGAAEALRRAQPQVLICWFGIRPRLKPFSSVVLFEEQNRANPVPNQEDPAASIVDAEILAEYVYRMAVRLPAYQGRTLALLTSADLDRVLALGPEGLAGRDLSEQVCAWLHSGI